MKKFPIETINSVSNEMFKDIFVSIKNRKNFYSDGYSMKIPVYFYRIIGIDEKIEEHYNRLFELDKKLNLFDHQYLKITEGFRFEYSKYVEKNFEEAWDKIIFHNRKKGDFIVSILEMYDVLQKYSDENLYKLTVNGLESIINHWLYRNDLKELKDLKDMLFKVICYIRIYVYNLFRKFDYKEVNPKVLYYGDLYTEEAYFLMVLSRIGADIVYLNSLSDECFSKIDGENKYSQKIEYSIKSALKPFPKHKMSKKDYTVAFQASKEIEGVLYTKDSGIYKPWQFLEYTVRSTILNTTYDEIYILSKEPSKLRPSFKIDRFNIFIPTFFAKIAGTHKEVSKYWDELNVLVKQEHTILIRDFPIINHLSEVNSKTAAPFIYGVQSAYSNLLDHTLRIEPEKLMQSEFWKYNHLRNGLQISIANKIADFCFGKSSLKKEKIDNTMRMKLLLIFTNIEEKFLQLLQLFDYPNQVPKVILYSKGQSMSFEEAALLVFLNALGLDVFMFNPTGYNDVEPYVEANFCSKHILSNMQFELEYKEPFIKKQGFWGLFFK